MHAVAHGQRAVSQPSDADEKAVDSVVRFDDATHPFPVDGSGDGMPGLGAPFGVRVERGRDEHPPPPAVHYDDVELLAHGAIVAAGDPGRRPLRNSLGAPGQVRTADTRYRSESRLDASLVGFGCSHNGFEMAEIPVCTGWFWGPGYLSGTSGLSG